MLVLRIGNRLQGTRYWTKRTSLPENCPQLRLPSIQHIPTGRGNGYKNPHENQRPQSSHNPSSNHSSVNAAQFLRTVIQKLPFLMNEIRTKKNFSSILINCSPFKSNYYRHYQQRRRHHQRSHRASSKSNKVFLRYTPRDPRLRFNKHSSELSEDIFNYGELIGGSISTRFLSSTSSSTFFNNNNNVSRYNNVEGIHFKEDSSCIISEQNCIRLFSTSIY